MNFGKPKIKKFLCAQNLLVATNYVKSRLVLLRICEATLVYMYYVLYVFRY